MMAIQTFLASTVPYSSKAASTEAVYTCLEGQGRGTLYNLAAIRMTAKGQRYQLSPSLTY